MQSSMAHTSGRTFTGTKFSNRLLGISWTHMRLMSLPWCPKIFPPFWFLSVTSHILLIVVNGMGTAFFFFLPVAWFTLGPSQSRYCQNNIYPIFTCNIHFSHHFQFLKLLFHFGFHHNHMSLLTNIFNAISLTASPLIGHDDSAVCKTPSFWEETQ